MFIYQPGTRGRRSVFITPGKEFPVSDWLSPEGKPLNFSIEFTEGRAEVPDNIGQYMIDIGMAAASPIILPRAEQNK